MAKMYFNRSEVIKHQVLSEELLSLVEQGITQREKQSIFRSLYDIEIAGVVVYYRKNWRFEGLSQDGNQIGPYKDELRASWPIVEAEGAREKALVSEPLIR